MEASSSPATLASLDRPRQPVGGKWKCASLLPHPTTTGPFTHWILLVIRCSRTLHPHQCFAWSWIGFSAPGSSPSRLSTCNSLAAMVRLAATGLGIAILPPSLSGPELAAGHLRSLRAPPSSGRNPASLLDRGLSMRMRALSESRASSVQVELLGAQRCDCVQIVRHRVIWRLTHACLGTECAQGLFASRCRRESVDRRSNTARTPRCGDAWGCGRRFACPSMRRK